MSDLVTQEPHGKLTVRIYANDVCIRESDDERIVAAVMTHIVRQADIKTECNYVVPEVQA